MFSLYIFLIFEFINSVAHSRHTLQQCCLLSGMDVADSISLDPHKSLFQPYGTGVVLVRDESKLKAAMAIPSTPYDSASLNEDFENESPACYTFELTRPFRALPVWFSINLLGMCNIKLALDEKLELAQYLYKELSRQDKLVLGPYPQLTTVLFR